MNEQKHRTQSLRGLCLWSLGEIRTVPRVGPVQKAFQPNSLKPPYPRKPASFSSLKMSLKRKQCHARPATTQGERRSQGSQ